MKTKRIYISRDNKDLNQHMGLDAIMIRKKLIETIKLKGITIYEAAKQVGMNRLSLSEFIRNKRDLHYVQLIKIQEWIDSECMS